VIRPIAPARGRCSADPQGGCRGQTPWTMAQVQGFSPVLVRMRNQALTARVSTGASKAKMCCTPRRHRRHRRSGRCRGRSPPVTCSAPRPRSSATPATRSAATAVTAPRTWPTTSTAVSSGEPGSPPRGSAEAELPAGRPRGRLCAEATTPHRHHTTFRRSLEPWHLPVGLTSLYEDPAAPSGVSDGGCPAVTRASSSRAWRIRGWAG
jgi:hypothetical protein